MLKGEEMIEFSKKTTFCKIMLKNLTSNAVISEVVTLMSVVLTKEDKHVFNGELLCTTECITL